MAIHIRFLLLVSFSCLLFGSCEKTTDCCTIRETAIDIRFVDNDGKDLLDESNEASYKKENIDLYYLINGVKEKFNSPILDHPEGFFIYKIDSTSYMRIYPSESKTNNKSTTFIELNNSDTDTLISEYASTNVVIKIWYNGKSVWDNKTGRIFTVIK